MPPVHFGRVNFSGRKSCPAMALRFVANFLVLVCPFTFLFMAHTSVSAAPEFKAAASRTDITPPLEARLWGYSNRKGGASGVLDPLYARVLVLDDGGIRIALVTLDLGRSFG